MTMRVPGEPDRRGGARRSRSIGWVVVVLLGAFVGFARVHRGMHHVTDVVAGGVLGLCALAIAWRACGTSRPVALQPHGLPGEVLAAHLREQHPHDADERREHHGADHAGGRTTRDGAQERRP